MTDKKRTWEDLFWQAGMCVYGENADELWLGKSNIPLAEFRDTCEKLSPSISLNKDECVQLIDNLISRFIKVRYELREEK